MVEYKVPEVVDLRYGELPMPDAAPTRYWDEPRGGPSTEGYDGSKSWDIYRGTGPSSERGSRGVYECYGKDNFFREYFNIIALLDVLVFRRKVVAQWGVYVW